MLSSEVHTIFLKHRRHVLRPAAPGKRFVFVYASPGSLILYFRGKSLRLDGRSDIYEFSRPHLIIIIARYPGDLERFIYGAPGRCSLNSFYKTPRGGSRTAAGDASTGLSIRSALNLAPGVGVYVG